MTEFKRGDFVEIIEVDEDDIELDIGLGDVGIVVDDTLSLFVTFIDNTKHPVNRHQLKLLYRKPETKE